jgi:hypothetical protein
LKLRCREDKNKQHNDEERIVTRSVLLLSGSIKAVEMTQVERDENQSIHWIKTEASVVAHQFVSGTAPTGTIHYSTGTMVGYLVG